MSTEPGRASEKLKSMLGMERTLNAKPHGPVHVRVQDDGRAFATVEIENSDGEWRAQVTKSGVVEELVATSGEETPAWVLNTLENLGFREVPGAPIP